MTSSSSNPRLQLVEPYLRRAPSSRLEEWLPFVSGFMVVVICGVEWYRRRWS